MTPADGRHEPCDPRFGVASFRGQLSRLHQAAAALLRRPPPPQGHHGWWRRPGSAGPKRCLASLGVGSVGRRGGGERGSAGRGHRPRLPGVATMSGRANSAEGWGGVKTQRLSSSSSDGRYSSRTRRVSSSCFLSEIKYRYNLLSPSSAAFWNPSVSMVRHPCSEGVMTPSPTVQFPKESTVNSVASQASCESLATRLPSQGPPIIPSMTLMDWP